MLRLFAKVRADLLRHSSLGRHNFSRRDRDLAPAVVLLDPASLLQRRMNRQLVLARLLRQRRFIILDLGLLKHDGLEVRVHVVGLLLALLRSNRAVDTLGLVALAHMIAIESSVARGERGCVSPASVLNVHSLLLAVSFVRYLFQSETLGIITLSLVRLRVNYVPSGRRPGLGTK